MDCSGRIMNVLGDSITEGVGTTGKDRIYCSLLKDRLELAQVRNYGAAGSRIAAHRREDGSWSNGGSFCERAKGMDPQADLVLVFGGTNDFGQGDAPLGLFSDRTTHTFYGACHVLMHGLIEAYPDAVIVFLTPTHRRDENNPRGSWGQKPRDDGRLIDYVKAIRETAAFYSLPVLDLYAMSGMQPNIPVIAERYCPDQLHFNDAGHRRIADRLEAFLRAY